GAVRLQKKRTKNGDNIAIAGVGQPILTQAIACIFFRRVHAAGTCPGTAKHVKNRAKATRKMPSAGKSTCISVAILTCFASGRTLASLAMGRPIRGFHRGRAKDCEPKCVTLFQTMGGMLYK